METVIGTVIVGIVEAIIFRWLWKKKASPVREALKVVVGAVKKKGADMVAAEVKKVLAKNPKVKDALDSIIDEAHARIKPTE